MTMQQGGAAAVDPNTIAPDTGQPLTKVTTARFMIGFIVFGIMWMMSGTIGSSVLFPQRFEELWPGQGESILTAMNSIGIIFALLSSIICGSLSDRTRSRFGKRTPWVIGGGFVCGLAFWSTSSATTIPMIVASWSLLQIGLNAMLTPVTAMMSERIPACNRGLVSAFYGGGNTVGSSVGIMIGSHFLTDPVPGFMLGVIAWCLTGIMAIVIWPTERSSKDDEPREPLSLKTLFSVFQPPTKNCFDYYMAFAGRLFFYLGMWGVYSFQLYILQKYIGLSVKESGAVMTNMSLVIMVISLIASLTSGYISDKFARRKPIVAAATLLVAIGIAAPWLMKSVTGMYIFAGCYALGNGIYGAVDQALNIDVLPDKKNAGKDLGFLNIATNVGQICSPIIGSTIVGVTGSYFLVFPAALVFLVAGSVVIMFIKKVR